MIKFYSTWTPCLITGGVEVVSRRDQEIKYVNGLMEVGREGGREGVGLESAAGKGELVPSTPQRYINAGWLLCPSLLGYNCCQGICWSKPVKCVIASCKRHFLL